MRITGLPLSLRLFLCTCLAALSACAPVGTPAPSPTASPVPTAAGEQFTSQRFGYVFVIPAGWIIKDKPGEWADFDPLDPNRGQGIDAFAAYLDGRNLALGIGARPLSDAGTLQEWSTAAQELIKRGVSQGVCYEGIEDDPVSVTETILDGEPALLLEYHCPAAHDKFGLVLLAIHDGQGYWITWLSSQDNPAADRAEFARILGSFAFTD
jgi:hypothetical protein